MPKTREQKQKIIQELEQDLKAQKALILVDFSGCGASALLALRQELKQSQCLLKIVKKTLLQKAIEGQKSEAVKALSDKLADIKTQLALVLGFDDVVSPAKICYQFSQENEALSILGGLAEKEILNQEQAIELAKIPSKEQLLARAMGALNAPCSNFVFALQGNLQKLIFALNAIKGQKNN